MPRTPGRALEATSAKALRIYGRAGIPLEKGLGLTTIIRVQPRPCEPLMKTSRVARETAFIAGNTAISTGRQTRSSLTATIRAFAAENAVNFAVKQEEEVNDDSSSLSSLSSPGVSDIEDALVSLAPGKRKRGIDDLAKTAVTTAPALARVPPRGTTFKSEDGSPAKIKKGRKQPAKKVVTETGEVAIHPPANWEEIYAAVQEMRKQVLAPVDTMGCESLAEDHRTPQVRPTSSSSLRSLLPTFP